MWQKASISAIALILIALLTCGCLGGGQTSNETTSPLANSLLVVRSVEAMIGYNTSLSCVLNTSNGLGLMIKWSIGTLMVNLLGKAPHISVLPYTTFRSTTSRRWPQESIALL